MASAVQTHPDQLIAEARGGKRDSLGKLLDLYRNYLRILARTQIDLHLQSKASPSDLVQETFLHACRNFQQFRGISEKELLGWLRKILLHNLAKLVETQILAKKRDIRREISIERRMASMENSSNRIEALLVSPCSSPSFQAQRRELAAQVADQLAQLPPAYREVIILRNLEGLSFEQVATRMERTTGAVRVLWLRALEKLRRIHLGEGQP